MHRIHHKILIAIASVTLVALWIMSRLPALYIVDAGHDDQLYVRLAQHLLQGEWLGPYDRFTLLKGPFFSIWITFVHLLGIPLLVAQLVLYLAAGLAVMAAVIPLRQWRWPVVLAYVAYSFQPTLYCDQMRRVIRDPLYSALTVGALAALLWVIRTRPDGIRCRLAVASITGLVLAAQYLTREEGIWMAPLVAVVAAFLLLRPGRSGFHGFVREAFVVGAAFLAFILVVCGFKTMNRATYGVWDIVEFKQAAFLDCFGSLARIDAGPLPPFVFISRKARDMAYEVSPSFLRIREALDGPDGTAHDWAASDAADFHITPPDGELRPKVVFALKDAVARCGLDRTAVSAKNYWQQVAREVNAAVDAGKIPGKQFRGSLAPPLTVRDLKAASAKLPDALLSTLRFDRTESTRATSYGNPHNFALFRDMIFGPYAEPALSLGLPTQRIVQEALLSCLGRSGQGYRLLTPILFSLAVCGWIWCLLLLDRRGINGRMVGWLGALSLVLIASRLSLLCYLAVTAMPDPVNPAYNGPTYAIVIIFSSVVIASAFIDPLRDYQSHA